MAVTCQLGALDLSSYLRDDPRVGGAVKQWDEVSGTHADIAAQANVRTSSLIEMVLPLAVTAANADALIAAIAAIRTECKKPTNTLAVKPTGATNEVIFKVKESPHLITKWDGAYDVGKLALFDLVLVCEPWAYASSSASLVTTTALNASAQTFPDGLSFKAAAGDAVTIAGDTDTPLTVTVVPTAGEANMHCLYAGWYPAADWTAYLVETDAAATWVGGTAADAALDYEHDSASVKNTGTTYSYFPIDTSGYTAGSYLVLARVALENASDTGTLKLSTSLGDITDEVTFDPDGTHFELIELGVVHLPVLDTVSGTAATLRVSMKCSAARFIAMDYVGFVPLDHGFFGYHPATATTASASIKSELGKLYDASVVTYANASGHGIKAHGLGTLVVFAEEVDNASATYSGTITVSYVARHELWR
jgi:hypothetical protein